MQQHPLDEPARELLSDIIMLAEEDQPVLVHDGIRSTDRTLVMALVLMGLVELVPRPVPEGEILPHAHECWPTLNGYNALRSREAA